MIIILKKFRVGLLALVLCVSCASPARENVIVTAIPGLAELARGAVGSEVKVHQLLASGVEPHDFEPSPRQVDLLSKAVLTLRIKGVQPSIDKLATSDDGDVSDGSDNPHVWLTPRAARAALERVAELVEANFVSFRRTRSFLEYSKRLSRLDEAYVTGLSTCTPGVVVTPHRAFGGLSVYGVREEPMTVGSDPEGEPSPARLQEVARIARAAGVKVIFYEKGGESKVARLLAAQISASVRPIDTFELGRGSLLGALASNLEELKTACS